MTRAENFVLGILKCMKRLGVAFSGMDSGQEPADAAKHLRGREVWRKRTTLTGDLKLKEARYSMQ